MGLRSKLIVAVVAAVAFGFAAAGIMATRHAEQLLVQEVRARGRALLNAMSPPCAIAMAQGEFEFVDHYVGQVSETRRARGLELRYVMVLDDRGQLYSHTDPTKFGTPVVDEFYQAARRANHSLFRRLRQTGKPALLEVSTPIVSGVRWGTLLAGFSLAREEQTLSRARWRVIGGTAAVAAASGLVLFLVLTLSVLTPVRRLAAAAKSFAAGRLDKRVPAGGRDELAQLGSAFNHMAGELAAHTQKLERKVQERTTEIREKNEELTLLNEELEKKSEQLEKLAITDGLTGLFNHRHFRERLAFEITRSGRKVHPISVILIDVDHFKNYNDANGHLAGDAVLRRLAELFHDNLRSVDLVARYGGEEFVILLLDTELEGAQTAAEKIRQAVHEARFEGERRQPSGRLTISLGVASYPHNARMPSELIAAADQALYEAKAAGRDCVVVAQRKADNDG